MSSTAQTVPLSVALVAGALVALNPCRVPLLPAFLSYYLGGGGNSQQNATSPSTQTLSPSTRLVDLEHPGRTPALFALFNADQGLPRLVLLISPT